MSADLPKAALCFGLYDQKNIVGFIAIIHQPHPKHRNLKRVSRLVILPDYQGVGLGTKLLTFAVKYWNKRHMDLCIDTSAKNLISALRKNSHWRMYAYMKTKRAKNGRLEVNRKIRDKAYTGRFMYKA